MTHPLTLAVISADTLREQVRALHDKAYRLVQIGATRLTEGVELTYSFDRDGELVNLRVCLPAEAARVESISSIYWCAFLYENEIHDLFNVQVDGMAIDFQGKLYTTAVKFPFGSPRAPAAKPANAPAPAPAQPRAAAPTGAAPSAPQPQRTGETKPPSPDQTSFPA